MLTFARKVLVLGSAAVVAFSHAAAAPEPADRWFTALRQMDVETKKNGAYGIFLFAGRQQAVPALQQMLNDSPDAAWTAAAALARLGDRSGAPVLLRALADTSGERAAVTAALLGRLPGLTDAVPALVKAASNRDENVRWSAVRSMGELGDQSFAPVLEQIVRNDEWFIREGAAYALYRIGAKDLVRRLMKDSDKTVRWAAVTAMSEARDPAMFDTLAAAAGDPDYDVRASAISVLGETGDPRAVSVLLNFLDDADQAVRWNVILSLGSLGDPSAAAPLQRLLGDRRADVRIASLKALGSLRGFDAVPVLIRSLGDRDSSVRGIAASLLGRARDARAAAPLKNLFNREPNHHATVLCALADIGDQSVVQLTGPALAAAKSNDAVVKASLYALLRTGAGARAAELLKKATPEQKKFALALMRETGTPAGMEDWLITAAGSPDREIRIAGARVLGRSVSPAAGAALARMLTDGDPAVRRWAALMMGMSGTAAARDRLVQCVKQEADADVAFAAAAALRLLGAAGDRPRKITVTRQAPLIRWKQFKEDPVRMLRPGDILPACGMAGGWYVSEDGWVDRESAELPSAAVRKAQGVR